MPESWGQASQLLPQWGSLEVVVGEQIAGDVVVAAVSKQTG